MWKKENRLVEMRARVEQKVLFIKNLKRKYLVVKMGFHFIFCIIGMTNLFV